MTLNTTGDDWVDLDVEREDVQCGKHLDSQEKAVAR